jgi:hypothetical protein
MPPTPDEPITAIAQRLTMGGRQDEYGHPYDDFARIAALWSTLLGVPVTSQEVGLCMIALKMARLCHSTFHRDSLIDIAGYANCLDMIRQRAEEISNGRPSDSLK